HRLAAPAEREDRLGLPFHGVGRNDRVELQDEAVVAVLLGGACGDGIGDAGLAARRVRAGEGGEIRAGRGRGRDGRGGGGGAGGGGVAWRTGGAERPDAG